IAGFRVFGRVRTTTPVLGPSVLLLPPRLSLSLMFLPRPSCRDIPVNLGRSCLLGKAPEGPPAASRSTNHIGSRRWVKRALTRKDQGPVSANEKRPWHDARAFFRPNTARPGGRERRAVRKR